MTIQYKDLSYLIENELNDLLIRVTVHLSGLNSFSVIEGDVYKNNEPLANLVYSENGNYCNKVVSDCLTTDKSRISIFIDDTIDEIKEYLNSNEHSDFMRQHDNG